MPSSVFFPNSFSMARKKVEGPGKQSMKELPDYG